MSNKLRLSIITPTRRMFDSDVDMVIMRGISGDFGVLPGHEPTTTALTYGILRVFSSSEQKSACVLGGFVEIQPDRVTVMTDAAEWPDEIDKNRAAAARERAERRIREHQSNVDLTRAELALKRALLRSSF